MIGNIGSDGMMNDEEPYSVHVSIESFADLVVVSAQDSQDILVRNARVDQFEHQHSRYTPLHLSMALQHWHDLLVVLTHTTLPYLMLHVESQLYSILAKISQACR